MISSMTGFGRGEYSDNRCRITVEIKSVNRDKLDLGIRMPKQFYPLESAIRQVVLKQIGRGKVDMFINWDSYDVAEGALHFNEALAGAYIEKLRYMSDSFGLDGIIRPSDVARFPDVFKMEDSEEDEQELWTKLEKALLEALDAFKKARASEGEKLKTDLIGKLDEMQVMALDIEAHEPEIMEAYREKLLAKVQEILGDTAVDESRIATEVVVYADRICTDEETVRLKSHIGAMKDTLEKGGVVGKKLDFLAQEMNREANTILSKSKDLQTSDNGIALKTVIEKLREQIQNIE